MSVLQTSPVAANHLGELDSSRPPQLLSPLSVPTEYVPGRHIQLSPLCPPNASAGRSREKTHLEAMLQASRERSAMLRVRKPLELRKEIAVKAQKVTQFERRARFLNKLCEPPSPSAADSPVTPPDSPTIFHFTLPSPGLQSPFEVFEDVHDHPERYRNTKRVEQVDFGLQYKKHRVNTHRQSSSVQDCVNLLPSLDQISKRLNKSLVSSNPHGSPISGRGQKGKSRLPPFLRSRSFSPLPEATSASNEQPLLCFHPVRPRLALRPATPPGHLVDESFMSQHSSFLEFTLFSSDKRLLSQSTVSLCFPPQSRSLETVCPETTEFDSEQSEGVSEGIVTTVTVSTPGLRAQLTKDMFNKLSRRTPGIPNAVARGFKARDDTPQTFPGHEFENKTWRRRSAPARVPTARSAHHSVLEKPGGF